MAGWQYKVVEIDAAKLVRLSDPGVDYVSRDSRGRERHDGTPFVWKVEGWRVDDGPRVWPSPDDVLASCGEAGGS